MENTFLNIVYILFTIYVVQLFHLDVFVLLSFVYYNLYSQLSTEKLPSLILLCQVRLYQDSYMNREQYTLVNSFTYGTYSQIKRKLEGPPIPFFSLLVEYL